LSAKPKILVLKGRQPTTQQILQKLTEDFHVVPVDSLLKGLAVLRHGGYAGAFVEATDLKPLERVVVLLQADLVLDAMSDGVVLLSSDLEVLWANRQFTGWVRPDENGDRQALGRNFYQLLGDPEVAGAEDCPFRVAAERLDSRTRTLRTDDDRCLRVTATPVVDENGTLSHLIGVVRDTTAEYLQQQKIDTLHQLAVTLGDLDPADVAEMSTGERVEVLKADIVRLAREVLGHTHLQLRLLDPGSRRLNTLISEGMAPEAERELFAEREGHGISGLVAATGQSYLCRDTNKDPLYEFGLAKARSSITVPLTWHDRVIGIFNVESDRDTPFDHDDVRFLEIFAGSVSLALHTLDLLQVEKVATEDQWVNRTRRAAGVLINDVLSDTAILLDHYGGHEPGVLELLERIQHNARTVSQCFRQSGQEMGPLVTGEAEPREQSSVLKGRRVLVADADLHHLLRAYELLSRAGCVVETAHNGTEAVAMAKTNRYDLVLADIRMPDSDGFQMFCQLKQQSPDTPVALVTAFGYDPSHTIVKCRAEGLRTVLFKPFQPHKLCEELERLISGDPPSN